jgi:hypothetical protein
MANICFFSVRKEVVKGVQDRICQRNGKYQEYLGWGEKNLTFRRTQKNTCVGRGWPVNRSKECPSARMVYFTLLTNLWHSTCVKNFAVQNNNYRKSYSPACGTPYV